MSIVKVTVFDLASSPTTPPHILEQLWKDIPRAKDDGYTSVTHTVVRSLVINNPNTPVEILIEHGHLYPESLLTNPVLDLLLLENPLFFNLFGSNLGIILECPTIPERYAELILSQFLSDLYDDTDSAGKNQMYKAVYTAFLTQKHLSKIWNKVSTDFHPTIEYLNISKALIYNLTFKQVTFRNVTFDQVSIIDVNFDECIFNNVIFTVSKIYESRFQGLIYQSKISDSHCIYFNNCFIFNTIFKSCDYYDLQPNIIPVLFNRCEIKHTTWNNCRLIVAFKACTIEGNYTYCDFTNAFYSYCQIYAIFDNCRSTQDISLTMEYCYLKFDCFESSLGMSRKEFLGNNMALNPATIAQLNFV